MRPFRKGDKVTVKPWNEGFEPKTATVTNTETSGRQVEVDYGKGRYQWVASHRVERASE